MKRRMLLDEVNGKTGKFQTLTFQSNNYKKSVPLFSITTRKPSPTNRPC